MSFVFRQGEGSRTATSRTILSAASGFGGGSVGFFNVQTGSLTTPLIGDVLEDFNAISGNAGYYTLVALSGTTGYFVRPPPNAQSVSGGSLNRLNRASIRLLSASGLTNITPLSGSANLAAVYVSGANFRANGIQQNDRLVLSGSAVSGNWGGWFIQSVPSEDVVICRPPDNGPGMAADSGGGNVQIRFGVHVVSGVAETVYSLSGILASGTALAGPAGGSQKFGSGEMRDYIRRQGVGSRTLYELVGLTQIYVNASGVTSGASWVSENEIVLALITGNRGNTGEATFTRFNPQGDWSIVSGNAFDMRIGLQPGDRYSAASGSVWVNVQQIGATLLFGTRGRINLFGSYYDPQDTGTDSGTDSKVSASIVRGGFRPYDGSILESPVFYDSFALNVVGDVDQANVLVANMGANSSVTTAGAVFLGLLMSDGIGSNRIFSVSADIFDRDPRQDNDLVDFWDNIGGSVTKQYTWNPIFVTGVSPIVAPTPVEGLTVVLYEVDEVGGETQIFQGLTDANGVLDTGSGWTLRTQRLENAGNTSSYFSHRLVLQGAGFRLISQRFSTNQPETGNIFVSRIAPSYEEEFDE